MLPPSVLFPPLSRLKREAVLLAALGGLLIALPSAAETTTTESTAPAETAATVAATPAAANPVTCEYGCEDHREGTEICIDRKQHRCGVKGWEPTGRICTPPPPVMIR